MLDLMVIRPDTEPAGVVDVVQPATDLGRGGPAHHPPKRIVPRGSSEGVTVPMPALVVAPAHAVGGLGWPLAIMDATDHGVPPFGLRTRPVCGHPVVT